jgi:hypothetical protein
MAGRAALVVVCYRPAGAGFFAGFLELERDGN